MPRMPVLAVWTTGLKTNLLMSPLAIVTDITHPNVLVMLTSWMYTTAIHYLLLNPTYPERGIDAYNLVVNMIKMEQTKLKGDRDPGRRSKGTQANKMLLEWLDISK